MNISTTIAKLNLTRRDALSITFLTYMLARYYFKDLNAIKPAAVIAGIPLGTVTELSHGISDREVRYRANGGVFLAHQSGGNESLRIIGQAWGPNRFLFLNMLDFLFVYGSSKVIDVFAGFDSAFPGQGNLLHVQGDPTTQIPKGIDPWQEVKLENVSEGYKEQHLTFPIITRNRIYLSMYIETYTWRQRIDVEGRKMVEYTIFFRKYEPLEEFEFGIVEVPAKDPAEAPKRIRVYKERYKKENPSIYVNWRSGVEILMTLFINFGDVFNINNISNFGTQFQMNYFGIDSQEGRIPGIIEQRFF